MKEKVINILLQDKDYIYYQSLFYI